MGDGMPYQLEKGPLLRVFESGLNLDRAAMEALLVRLRDSERTNEPDWLIDSQVWQHSAFARGPQPGTAMRDRVLTEWFGLTAAGPAGTAPPQDPSPGTTGYWTGYRGDVHKIVVTALRWAVELALSVGSDDRTAAGVEPWPIELFWKCPAPWFEAWVVSRRSGTGRNGLVTVVFVTPSHRGATVAQSPVAHSPVATPSDASHAVPSFQDDYEQLGRPHPNEERPRVPARQRDFATWVVTHERNEVADPTGPTGPEGARAVDRTGTATPRDLFDWEVPQLAVYEGRGDVVVVSPSMAAGGIKHDGKV
jgi:hypothetical protein